MELITEEYGAAIAAVVAMGILVAVLLQFLGAGSVLQEIIGAAASAVS